MSGRLKYFILLMVTASITVSLAIYGVTRYVPRQGKIGENAGDPPIGQNTKPGDFRLPIVERSPQLESLPQPAPDSAPQPIPAPTPQLKSKPGPKTPKDADTPRDYIGSFRTPLLDKSYGRTKNIELASKKINGYVVEPGRSFSFNGIVGERTIQKGYMSAKVIIGGKFVDDTGGGICQLSSTLYNAAEKAGLQILERHNHSRKVSYVNEGRDAAVDYGNLDFRFKNILNYPIEIKAGVKNGEVYAYIVKIQRKTPASS